jgi:hypothetical protein
MRRFLRETDVTPLAQVTSQLAEIRQLPDGIAAMALDAFSG